MEIKDMLAGHGVIITADDGTEIHTNLSPVSLLWEIRTNEREKLWGFTKSELAKAFLECAEKDLYRTFANGWVRDKERVEDGYMSQEAFNRRHQKSLVSPIGPTTREFLEDIREFI